MFKYQVIKNAVSFELANFIFNYFLLKRDAVKFLYDNNVVYDTSLYGTWSDQQVPNTYSHYADMVMETLMMKVLPRMEKETGLKLLPTYSYARLYKKGDILKRHKDRPSSGSLQCSNSQPLYTSISPTSSKTFVPSGALGLCICLSVQVPNIPLSYVILF